MWENLEAFRLFKFFIRLWHERNFYRSIPWRLSSKTYLVIVCWNEFCYILLATKKCKMAVEYYDDSKSLSELKTFLTFMITLQFQTQHWRHRSSFCSVDGGAPSCDCCGRICWFIWACSLWFNLSTCLACQRQRRKTSRISLFISRSMRTSFLSRSSSGSSCQMSWTDGGSSIMRFRGSTQWRRSFQATSKATMKLGERCVEQLCDTFASAWRWSSENSQNEFRSDFPKCPTWLTLACSTKVSCALSKHWIKSILDMQRTGKWTSNHLTRLHR